MYSVVLATLLAGGSASPGQWGCSCSGSHYSAYQGCHGYSSYYGCGGYYGAGYSGSCCGGHGGVRVPQVMPIPAAPVPHVMPIPGAPVPLAVPTPAPPSPTVIPLPARPVPAVVPLPPPTLEPPTIREESAQLTARRATAATSATVTVRLPADARLYVDDAVCPLTSSVRSFTATGLEPGREYFYVLRVEVLRGGQTLVQSQRVAFEAGRGVAVNFAGADEVRSVQR